VLRFAEYSDPRLVAVYDTVCPFGVDTAFWLDLAGDRGPATVVDVGCGTGALTCELAARGHDVTGLEPSAAMLAVARTRPGHEDVRWIEGDASRLEVHDADLALMTSHVAQVIVDDDVWRMTLHAVAGALRPGGRLAFDSRDPRARWWAAGNAYDARRRFPHPESGWFETWQVISDVRDGLVDYELHYRFGDGDGDGDELVSHNQLRFRTRDELTAALADVGLPVTQVYGDWDRRPVGAATPELLVVATRD
jgi:SAM-dependent methyltransferase